MSDVSTESQESMMKSIQENEDLDLNLEDIDLSLLRLNSFDYDADHLRERSLPPLLPSSTAAVASPLKRPSLERDAVDEPKAKKVFPQHEGFDSPPLSSYSKLGFGSDPNNDLTQTWTRSASTARRSLSTTKASPVKYSSGLDNLTRSRFRENVEALKQETVPFAGGSENQEPTHLGSGAHFLPPVPCGLRRSVSSLTSSAEKSPEYKMLKMFKDCVRELSGWCDELLRYDEGVGRGQLDDASKEMPEEGEIEEGVRVERVGDGYVVQFKCPCRQSYRVVCSGGYVYYKLL